MEEPAEEREHARLPVSDLKGLMGEQDFIQLEVLEKSSEREASFFQVGQTLEGRRSCPLDRQTDKSEETAGDEVTSQWKAAREPAALLQLLSL